MDTQTLTIQQRWTAAIDAIRESGVRFRMNVRKCCRGCIVEADLGLPEGSEQPYAYIYGGQGGAIYFDAEGNPVNRVRKHNWTGEWITEPEIAAFFNHGNGSAQVVADAFRAQGFDVTWDGDDSMCVVVNFEKVA